MVNSRSSRAWLLITVSIVLVVTLIAFSQIDMRAVFDEIRQLSALSLVATAAILILGVLLSTVRLWYISSDIGTPLTFREALLALSVGQIVGAVSVQFFGQIAARTALLGRRGLSAPANIVMATYERLVAVAVSGLMALAGAWYLFGRFVLDVEGGGAQLLRVMGGISIVVVCGAATAWGRPVFMALGKGFSASTAISIGRNLVLTVAVQLTTACSYFIIAQSMLEGVMVAPLIAAIVIIMFAASLPISFAGWGVRELSAVLALGAVGINAATAIAISVVIGGLALSAVIIVAGFATIIAASAKDNAGRRVAQTEDSNIAGVLKWTIPLAAATAVFFQIYIPTGTTKLNANLADPIVILGAAIFVLGYLIRGSAQWRYRGLNASILAMTAIVVLSYLHGYYVIGWTDWAFTNRLIGWFVLLCYGMTGALITLYAGKTGVEVFARTFISSAAAIVIFEIILIGLASAGVEFPTGLLILPTEGFSQNRNSFSFALLVAISALPVLRRDIRGIALAVFCVGLWFAGSRAALGTLAVLVILIWHLKIMSLRAVGVAVLASTLGLLTIAAIPSVAQFINPSWVPSNPYFASGIPVFVDTSILGSSNQERVKSMADGWSLFLSHPIFGAGLGVYFDSQMRLGKALVIHSTPIWLLAESGVVGLAAFLIPAVLIFIGAWRERLNDETARTIILTLITFAAMSSVHELLYQRIVWLVLGASLALAVDIHRTARKLH